MQQSLRQRQKQKKRQRQTESPTLWASHLSNPAGCPPALYSGSDALCQVSRSRLNAILIEAPLQRGQVPKYIIIHAPCSPSRLSKYTFGSAAWCTVTHACARAHARTHTQKHQGRRCDEARDARRDLKRTRPHWSAPSIGPFGSKGLASCRLQAEFCQELSSIRE